MWSRPQHSLLQIDQFFEFLKTLTFQMDLAQIDGDITLDGIKRGMNESLQAYSEQLTLLVSGQEDKYKGKGYSL